MKDYSYGEIARMQMKAMEDAKEMNSRSSFPNEEEKEMSSNECESCQNLNCDKNPKKNKKSLLGDIDDEKFLLLALIIILLKSSDDKMILLALAYILI